jgi:hypothetical protein
MIGPIEAKTGSVGGSDKAHCRRSEEAVGCVSFGARHTSEEDYGEANNLTGAESGVGGELGESESGTDGEEGEGVIASSLAP